MNGESEVAPTENIQAASSIQRSIFAGTKSYNASLNKKSYSPLPKSMREGNEKEMNCGTTSRPRITPKFI